MSRLPRRTATCSFEGTDYDGITVVLNLNVPIGYWLDADGREDDLASQAEFLRTIVKEWDLEDDRGPIPLTEDGVRRIDDIAFMGAIFRAWTAAMRGETEVSAPLGSTSNGGDT